MAAVREGAKKRSELHANFMFFGMRLIAGDRFSAQLNAVATVTIGSRVLLASHCGGEGNRSGLIGSDADRQNLIGIRREDLSLVSDSAHAVTHVDNGRVKIKLAAIVLRICAIGKLQPQ